jgi:4-aminobutyrate aminotransferase-like enzyme/Ser/Thr protein kinase RdoA (MazF antagonist)
MITADIQREKISIDQARRLVQGYFGMNGVMTRLPGEYDFNFHVLTDEAKEFTLKISCEHSSFEEVMMQVDLLLHLQATNLPFAIPLPIPNLLGERAGKFTSVSGSTHWVRLLTYVPGQPYADAKFHSPDLLGHLGHQLGCLTRALNNFHHSAAKRYLKWDLQQAEWIRKHLSILTNREDRECIEYFLLLFTTEVIPQLPHLRQSIIHGDLNDYNILVNAYNSKVIGIIDFGDLIETATVFELAIASAYAMLNQDDPLEAAAQVVKSYHSVYPLQEVELSLLFPLIAIRLCISVMTSALRKIDEPQNKYLTISEQPAWRLLRKIRGIKPKQASEILRHCSLRKQNILAARHRLIGKNVGLSYDVPLHIVRGEGQYLYDAQGRRYLDAVNNVAHVGHCHTKVVAAGQRQMAMLNTNTRYLHENLTHYAERLLATLPSSLEVCFFVCTGSEANDLALRLAAAHTKRKNLLVMDHGYYGHTSTLVAISPYKYNGAGGLGKPDYIDVIPLPDNLRNRQPPRIVVNPVSAFLSESLPSCGGQVVLPDGYLQEIYTEVRNHGGVCIADEVQVGLGRVGSHFWGFETQGVIPDIVTLGKPLGNGHPLAAVVTTREIADSFDNGMEYFNTFGGNPVSCAIGLAVLDVIKEESLQSHAEITGQYLKKQLKTLQVAHEVIGDVRGLGLFLGIEIITDSTTLAPDSLLAYALVNRLKERGILLSVDGPYHNVIKIKPPMIFTRDNCDELVGELENALQKIGK